MSNAAFSEADLQRLNAGESVTKLLPSEDKREVSVFGIIAINAQIEFGLREFQAQMSRQNKKSIMELGDFSDSPRIEDLERLTLEKNDIEDLKNCTVGKCSIGLSAEMIERFKKEIDWKAANYSVQATQMFRKMLLEYAQDYLTRGDEALIEYRNRANPLMLRDEQKSLLNRLFWLNDFAPEFSNYLTNFPKSQLNNVRKTLNWTKIKFGLKPVIIITQTITYTNEKNGVSQILSVSKQIYATRYFDSSLGLTTFIKFPDSGAESRIYLLYTNHSRSSSLEGAFSNFKHEIVEREAVEKLKPLLNDTKLRLENPTRNSTESIDISPAETFKIWLFENIFWLALGLLALLFFGYLFKRLKN